MCVLCGRENETAIHLFANCDFAHECWTVLNENWNLYHVESISLWIDEMWTTLPTVLLEKVVIICWAMWENRNAMVWKAQCKDPQSLVNHAIFYAHNWQDIREDTPSSTAVRVLPSLVSHWECPRAPFLKMNIDVAFDHTAGRMGFGWSVRDASGAVMGIMMYAITGLFSVR